MQDLHTQGSTLECLEDNEVNLTAECRHKVLRAAELQSDDYHMNRALYYACQDDREHFCPSTEAGEGRVYACLMKNKFHPEMSNEVWCGTVWCSMLCYAMWLLYCIMFSHLFSVDRS